LPKSLWFPALCALILVALTYAVNRPGLVPGSISGAIDVVQWPALLIAMLASGNAHAPSEWAFYIALFVMYLAACLVLMGAIRMLIRRASPSQPSHSSARKP